jgi:hypothetical protein
MADVFERWNVLVAQVNGKATHGEDGIRDPEFPCSGFLHGKPSQGTCESDGHYLCSECVERLTCDQCGKHPLWCECGKPPLWL